MGKLFKAVVAAAAIGSVCYVFRDKIKATKAYQTLGVDEKVEKVKSTIKEKMPVKDDAERDYFTLNDEDVASDPDIADAPEAEAEEASASEESEDEPGEPCNLAEENPAPSIKVVNEETSASDVSAMVDDLLSDIPDMK